MDTITDKYLRSMTKDEIIKSYRSLEKVAQDYYTEILDLRRVIENNSEAKQDRKRSLELQEEWDKRDAERFDIYKDEVEDCKFYRNQHLRLTREIRNTLYQLVEKRI